MKESANRSAGAMPKTVDRGAFEADLDRLRVREKAHTREGDAIAAARRRLPMVEVDAKTTLVGNGITLLLRASRCNLWPAKARACAGRSAKYTVSASGPQARNWVLTAWSARRVSATRGEQAA